MAKKTFEMSGYVVVTSQRGGQFKYKEDFVRWAKKFGWEHTKLTKETDYLVSSLSNSVKANKAKRYGIPVISYERALELIETSAKWELLDL